MSIGSVPLTEPVRRLRLVGRPGQCVRVQDAEPDAAVLERGPRLAGQHAADRPVGVAGDRAVPREVDVAGAMAGIERDREGRSLASDVQVGDDRRDRVPVAVADGDVDAVDERPALEADRPEVHPVEARSDRTSPKVHRLRARVDPTPRSHRSSTCSPMSGRTVPPPSGMRQRSSRRSCATSSIQASSCPIVVVDPCPGSTARSGSRAARRAIDSTISSGEPPGRSTRPQPAAKSVSPVNSSGAPIARAGRPSPPCGRACGGPRGRSTPKRMREPSASSSAGTLGGIWNGAEPAFGCSRP